MIVNDSEEDYPCKSGEVVTTMIPDPMGLAGWYGDEQASQVHREPPLDYVGLISLSKLRVISPSLNLHSKLPGIIDSTVSVADAERKYCSSVKKFDISDITRPSKVSAIAEAGEASPIIIQDVVPNHIIIGIENCMIKCIRKENLKSKRNRAVYLNQTNSSSDSEHEINAASIILDTPSFCAKVKKKSKVLGPSFSPSDNISTPCSSSHDANTLRLDPLSPINNDKSDVLSWNSNVAIACHHCSRISLNGICSFLDMPKTVATQKGSAKTAKMRAELRVEATERQRLAPLTYSCTICYLSLTRMRNLRVHMCTAHGLCCDTMSTTESFLLPDSVVRVATVGERVDYVKPDRSARRRRSTGPTPNRVVYDDEEDDETVAVVGKDVLSLQALPFIPIELKLSSSPQGTVGDDNDKSTNRDRSTSVPVIRIGVVADNAGRGLSMRCVRPASCSAAAGSAAQLVDDDCIDDASVDGTVSIATHEDDNEPPCPFSFSSVALDHMESYVFCAPMPWRVHALVPGLLRLLPDHDPAMLVSSLTSYLRGVKASADITLRTSASQSPISQTDRTF